MPDVNLFMLLQDLPQQYFDADFDAVRHDLGLLTQKAGQEAMEGLAEARTSALEVVSIAFPAHLQCELLTTIMVRQP